jgi:methylmalonyl-CoA mutase
MAHDAQPLRLLTAVPVCDGHDSAINTINLELVRAGMEVIYLGYHRPVRDIVRAAIQEGVAGVGISSYNGGHVEFFSEVVAGLRAEGAEHIGVFGGGGGTISQADADEMQRGGVERIFFAGTPLSEMTAWILQHYGTARPIKQEPAAGSDLAISQLLDAGKAEPSDDGPPVIGVTGPGGAGKTTLIDELVLRFLKTRQGRVAILSHDPSIVSNGALLGDRATMIHSQNDRVFMRSLATRGQAGGLGPHTAEALAVLKSLDFELIFIETVGTGQEAMPFRGEAMKSVFVMSPEYGSRLQLQKIAMLDLADLVVVNKNDRAGAVTARNELEQRIGKNRRLGKNQRVMTTCAKRHRDAGVDALFAALTT